MPTTPTCRPIGAAVVTAVVSDPGPSMPSGVWPHVRVRIREMRELLVAKLAERGVSQTSVSSASRTACSPSPVSKDQVERLKSEFAIHIVGPGRISVAGITRANIDPLWRRHCAVLGGGEKAADCITRVNI